MMASISRDESGRSNKRPRYSKSSTYRWKEKLKASYLKSEEKGLVERTSIDADCRFLPHGILQGSILEIKGPEKSGKTFLLTYFVVRMLVVCPDKKAVLIDTRHKFDIKNFLSIVKNFDSEISAQLNLSQPIDDLIGVCPKVAHYLDRLLVIPCYSAEDLMLTLEPSGESVVEKLLLNDPSVSLVAVDCIDNFAFAESLRAPVEPDNQWANIMENLKASVSQTKCPVICTTLIPVHKREYRMKYIPTKVNGQDGPSTSNATQLDNPSTIKDDECKSNFPIDYNIFTKILEIVPATEAEVKRNRFLAAKKSNHYASAYLRSKHSASAAGSGENQRVKFSIFSDMLWVEE